MNICHGSDSVESGTFAIQGIQGIQGRTGQDREKGAWGLGSVAGLKKRVPTDMRSAAVVRWATALVHAPHNALVHCAWPLHLSTPLTMRLSTDRTRCPAEKEIKLWFPEGVVDWSKSDDKWIYEAK